MSTAMDRRIWRSRCEHRAVSRLPIDPYRFVEITSQQSDFTYGQFGENFTVDGMADNGRPHRHRFQIGEGCSR